MTRTLFSVVCILSLFGCGEEKDSGGARKPDTGAASGQYAGIDISIPTVEYRLDPQAGDPAVSAELGGPGFTGKGWDTVLQFPAIGAAEAVKGGSLSRAIPDWPATLRMGGQSWNASINYLVRDLCFPALVMRHPVTLDIIPNLATHWQISEDKSTYRFRINPKARWSDGTEVTSQDYLASHKLWMDPTILFPSSQLVFGKFTPRAISKYIIEVRCSEENWRNFLYAGSLVTLPAKEIGHLTGTEFLEKFQFAYTAFCGPYMVEPGDIIMNESVTLTRNPDWWDADNPAWTGMYNIDKIHFPVVLENQLTYEKAKKGELDYYVITTAKWFAKDLPEEEDCKRGLVLRMKVFNDAPIGTSGIAINMSRPPLDDLKIRKALAHLFDREKMIEKLFFDEYAMLDSYWQGATYGNDTNQVTLYDEMAADELLNEAGYTTRDSDGWRVKDGRKLEFDVMYSQKGSEKHLTIYQEATNRLGIKLNLKLLTPTTFWRNAQEKEYELAMMSWGALITPNPETSWKGELGRGNNNNNITAFVNERVDELLVEYDREYDIQRRRQIMKQIDGIIFEQHPYVLAWYKPAQRVIIANKFGWPKWGTSRTYEDNQEMIYVWWVDPVKERALAEARADSTKILEIPPVENHFWAEWNAAQNAAGSP